MAATDKDIEALLEGAIEAGKAYRPDQDSDSLLSGAFEADGSGRSERYEGISRKERLAMGLDKPVPTGELEALADRHAQLQERSDEKHRPYLDPDKVMERRVGVREADLTIGPSGRNLAMKTAVGRDVGIQKEAEARIKAEEAGDIGAWDFLKGVFTDEIKQELPESELPKPWLSKFSIGDAFYSLIPEAAAERMGILDEVKESREDTTEFVAGLVSDEDVQEARGLIDTPATVAGVGARLLISGTGEESQGLGSLAGHALGAMGADEASRFAFASDPREPLAHVARILSAEGDGNPEELSEAAAGVSFLDLKGIADVDEPSIAALKLAVDKDPSIINDEVFGPIYEKLKDKDFDGAQSDLNMIPVGYFLNDPRFSAQLDVMFGSNDESAALSKILAAAETVNKSRKATGGESADVTERLVSAAMSQYEEGYMTESYVGKMMRMAGLPLGMLTEADVKVSDIAEFLLPQTSSLIGLTLQGYDNAISDSADKLEAAGASEGKPSMIDMAREVRSLTPRGLEMTMTSDAFAPIRDAFGLTSHRRFDADTSYLTRVMADYSVGYQTMLQLSDVMANLGIVERGGAAENTMDIFGVGFDFLVPVEKPVFATAGMAVKAPVRAYTATKLVPTSSMRETAEVAVRGAFPELFGNGPSKNVVGELFAAAQARAMVEGRTGQVWTPAFEDTVVRAIDNLGFDGESVLADLRRESANTKDIFAGVPEPIRALRELEGHAEFMQRVDSKLRSEGIAGTEAAFARSAYEMAAATAMERAPTKNPFEVVARADPSLFSTVDRVMKTGRTRTVARNFVDLTHMFLDPEDAQLFIRSFDHVVDEGGMAKLTPEGLVQMEQSIGSYLKYGAPQSVHVRRAADTVMEGLGGTYRAAMELGEQLDVADPARLALEKWFMPYRENFYTRFDALQSGAAKFKRRVGKEVPAPELKADAKKYQKIDLRTESIERAFSPERLAAGELSSAEIYNGVMKHIGGELASKVFKDDVSRITRRSIVPKKSADRIKKAANKKILDRIGLKSFDAIETADGKYTLSPRQAAGLKGHVMNLGSMAHGKHLMPELVRPGFDYKNISYAQMRNIIDVTRDSMAGVGSMMTVNDIYGGPSAARVLMSVGDQYLSDSRAGKQWSLTKKWFSDRFDTTSSMEKSVNPDLAGSVKEMNGSVMGIKQKFTNLLHEARKSSKTTDEMLVKYVTAARYLIGDTLPDAWLASADAYHVTKNIDRLDDAGMAKLHMSLGQDDNPVVVSALGIIQEIVDRTNEGRQIDLFGEEGVKGTTRDVVKNLSDVDRRAFEDSMMVVQTTLSKRMKIIEHEAKVIISALGDEKGGARRLQDSIVGAGEEGVEGGVRVQGRLAADIYTLFRSGEYAALYDLLDKNGINYSPDRGFGIPNAMMQVAISKEIAKQADQMVIAGLRLEDMAGPAVASGRNLDQFGKDVSFYIRQILDGDLFETINDDGTIASGVGPIDGSVHNVEAFNAAMKILRDTGYRFDESIARIGGHPGEWAPYSFADGSVMIIPPEMARYISDLQSNASSARDTIRSVAPVSETAWGGVASVKKGTTAGALSEIFKMFPGTVNYMQMNMTSGIIAPHPAYYWSVFFGNIFQTTMALGPSGGARVLSSIAREPKTAAHVWASMTSDGKYSPFPEGVITTADGKIYTNSELADLARKHGIKSSFVEAEFVASMQAEIRRSAPEVNRAVSSIRNLNQFWRDVATGIDGVFRAGIFVDQIRRGEAPSSAVRKAMDATFDYSDMTDFERQKIRSFILFYSFQRKSTDLFFRTLLDNPERILQHLRLYNSVQLAALDEDPEKVLPEYYRGRIPNVWKSDTANPSYGGLGYAVMAPMAAPMDSLYMAADLMTLWSGEGKNLDPTENRYDALRGFRNKIMPTHIPASLPQVGSAALSALAYFGDMENARDPLTGGPLEYRSVVPEWIVDMDNFMGGPLRHIFNFETDVAANHYAELSKMNQTTVTVAKNERAWFFFRNAVLGRYLSDIERLDAANPLSSTTEVMASVNAPDIDYVDPEPGLADPGEFSMLNLFSYLFGPLFPVPTPEQVERKAENRRIKEVENTVRDLDKKLDEYPE